MHPHLASVRSVGYLLLMRRSLGHISTQTDLLDSFSRQFKGRPRLAHGLVPKLLLLTIYLSSALAAPAADGLVDLFAVVSDGAEKHPPL